MATRSSRRNYEGKFETFPILIPNKGRFADYRETIGLVSTTALGEQGKLASVSSNFSNWALISFSTDFLSGSAGGRRAHSATAALRSSGKRPGHGRFHTQEQEHRQECRGDECESAHTVTTILPNCWFDSMKRCASWI